MPKWSTYKSNNKQRSDYDLKKMSTLRLSILQPFLLLGLIAISDAGMRGRQENVTVDYDDDDDNDDFEIDDNYFEVELIKIENNA